MAGRRAPCSSSSSSSVESSPGFQLETSRGLDSQLETPWARLLRVKWSGEAGDGRPGLDSQCVGSRDASSRTRAARGPLGVEPRSPASPSWESSPRGLRLLLPLPLVRRRHLGAHWESSPGLPSPASPLHFTRSSEPTGFPAGSRAPERSPAENLGSTPRRSRRFGTKK